MLLLIDNYDSFTANLWHALAADGSSVRVVRNDAITADEIESFDPEVLVVSPGPGTPERAGITMEAIRRSLGRRPVLGICLGHQAIAAVLGATIRRASRPVHGKTTAIRHDGRGIFAGLPSEFEAARYHSLVVEESTLPDGLRVAARAEDGEIMALLHERWPIAGLQFHPESYLTPVGPRLLLNVLSALRRGGPPAA